MVKVSKRVILIVCGLFVLIQFVPYGRDHTNPPVTQEPAWNAPEARALAAMACFDCHSNETRWPWYSMIAPASWLIYSDVSEGRSVLNFSDWNRVQKDAGDAAKEVLSGDMPPWYYLPMHPQARLTQDERETLARGLTAMPHSGPAESK
jgi:cytochrome c551/c552